MTANTGSSTPGQWDYVARQLQEWRLRADYRLLEIALYQADDARAMGWNPPRPGWGARRSTTRSASAGPGVSLGLVREIARALGVEEDAVCDLLETQHGASA